MKFSEVVPFIRPEVAGAPDFLIERMVRDICIDFCQRTDVYLAEPEDIFIVDGVSEYDVSIPSGTELNHILDVYDNRTLLKPIAYSKLLQVLGNESVKGRPKYYSMRDNNTFFVGPVPNTNYTFRALFSLKPNSTSTSIPNTVGRENRPTIVKGVLARMQSMNGQPWTSLNMAQINYQGYEKEVGRIHRESKYGFAGGALTAKYREFV